MMCAWMIRQGMLGLAILSIVILDSAYSQTAYSVDTSVANRALDATPFGFAESQADGRAYGVRWAEPRKIRQVVVEFAPDVVLPASDKLRVQYWHRSWGGESEPVLAEASTGAQGWAAMDDWTKGEWKEADTRVRVDRRRWTFTFAPTGDKEFDDLGQPGVAYRKTLKLRVIADEPLPKPILFQTFTDSVCRPLTVRIMWGTPAENSLQIDGEDPCHLQVFNNVRVGNHMHWTLPAGAKSGIEADLIVAVDPTDNRFDRTIVTVRSKYRPFSFAADEVARGDRILVNDLGVLVVRGDDAITLEGYRDALKKFPGRTVYDRVFDHAEQTLPVAWDAMPIKRAWVFAHGLPGNRNLIKQEPNGELAITKVGHWFNLRHRSPKDSDRKDWEGEFLGLGFGFPPQEKQAGRELEQGYLPLLKTQWVDGPIYYEQRTILDKLDGDLSEIHLDDPTVLLMSVRVVNTSKSASGTAHLRLTSCGRAELETTSRAELSEKLVVQGDRVSARSAKGLRFRYLIRSGDRGTITHADDGVRWTLELGPGEAHELFLAIPSVTLTTDEEIEGLGKRDFGADSRRLCTFWEKLAAKGTKIDTPEPWINDFYKAQLRHMQINCFKEPGSDLLFPHVGSFIYGVYCNEAVMMISDLDRRGYHNEAQRCLQTWLHYQGTVKLPGNFKSTEGLFYGADGSEAGGYNKHHGYACWCMAEHWRYTRDREWMKRSAPKLIKACEWIIRERQATMSTNQDGTRPIEYGFLPAGALEDVQDYWYWMATNVSTVWGFDALADALADYGHPEAARLQQQAKDYHDDVMRGLTESRIRAPVVRLRDGTYVPKYPSRLYERGRCVGWIREVLEGSLCLLMTGLIPPEAPDARWIMKDYEDNLYISDRYGYSIPVFDEFWFSRGGFSMQANLLDSPIPYLYRDEIKHFLRTYFNAFASAFYPEIRVFNEHSLPELGYPSGDIFKTSDEAQSTYWLRLMFVHERGDYLYLGQAIPRYWLADGESVGIECAASHFGPLSLQFTSRADRGEIKGVVTPPQRNRPKNIYLRFRHPQSKPIRSVTFYNEKYDRFDTKKEWVILPGSVTGVQEVIARY